MAEWKEFIASSPERALRYTHTPQYFRRQYFDSELKPKFTGSPEDLTALWDDFNRRVDTADQKILDPEMYQRAQANRSQKPTGQVVPYADFLANSLDAEGGFTAEEYRNNAVVRGIVRGAYFENVIQPRVPLTADIGPVRADFNRKTNAADLDLGLIDQVGFDQQTQARKSGLPSLTPANLSEAPKSGELLDSIAKDAARTLQLEPGEASPRDRKKAVRERYMARLQAEGKPQEVIDRLMYDPANRAPGRTLNEITRDNLIDRMVAGGTPAGDAARLFDSPEGQKVVAESQKAALQYGAEMATAGDLTWTRLWEDAKGTFLRNRMDSAKNGVWTAAALNPSEDPREQTSLAKRLGTAADDYMAQIPEPIVGRGFWGQGVVDVAGMAPLMIESIAATAVGGPVAGTAVFASDQIGRHYRYAIEEAGLAPGLSTRLAAISGGVLHASLEQASMSLARTPFGKSGRLAGAIDKATTKYMTSVARRPLVRGGVNFTANTAQQILQEGAQQVVEVVHNEFANYRGGKGFDIRQLKSQVMQAMEQAAAPSILLGAVLGLPAGGRVAGLSNAERQIDAAEAELKQAAGEQRTAAQQKLDTWNTRASELRQKLGWETPTADAPQTTEGGPLPAPTVDQNEVPAEQPAADQFVIGPDKTPAVPGMVLEGPQGLVTVEQIVPDPETTEQVVVVRTASGDEMALDTAALAEGGYKPVTAEPVAPEPVPEPVAAVQQEEPPVAETQAAPEPAPVVAESPAPKPAKPRTRKPKAASKPAVTPPAAPAKAPEPEAAVPEPAKAPPAAEAAEVLTFNEFSAARGVSSSAPSFPETHRKPGGVSKASDKAASDRILKANAEWQDQRDALRKEYDAEVKAGRIRPPDTKEMLEVVAQKEGPAAEAAQRVLEKRKAKTAEAPKVEPAPVEAGIVGRKWRTPFSGTIPQKVVEAEVVAVQDGFAFVKTDPNSKGYERIRLEDLDARIAKEEAATAKFEAAKPAQAEREAKIAAEDQAKADKLKQVDGFLADDTPMQAGKRRKVLTVGRSFNGKSMAVHQMVEEMVAQGATVVSHPEDKRRLQRPNGAFFTQGQTTSTGMDYAEFLIGQKPKAPAEAAKSALSAGPNENAKAEIEKIRAAIVVGKQQTRTRTRTAGTDGEVFQEFSLPFEVTNGEGPKKVTVIGKFNFNERTPPKKAEYVWTVQSTRWDGMAEKTSVIGSRMTFRDAVEFAKNWLAEFAHKAIQAVKDESGFVRLPSFKRKDMVRTTNEERGAVRKARVRFLTRGMPDPALKATDALAGDVAGLRYDLERRANDFQDAAKAAYGRAMTEQEAETANAVLNGKAPITAIPAPLRGAVTAMRNYLDKMTTEILDTNTLAPELAAKLRENLGSYLTRSYRIFDDPAYREEVLNAILGSKSYGAAVHAKVVDAVNYLTAEYTIPEGEALAATPMMDLMRLAARRGLPVKFGMTKTELLAGLQTIEDKTPSELEIKKMLVDLIQRANGSNEIQAFYMGSIQGQIDLRSMMRLKEIPVVLRDLMGEHKDPLVNFMRSGLRIGQHVANHKFQITFRELGLQHGFLVEGFDPGKLHPDPFNPTFKAKFATSLSKDGDPSTPEWDGIYGTQEIVDALRRAVEPLNMGLGMQAYYTASGLIKLNMTAGSIPSTARNFLSNIQFAVMQGHFKVWMAPKAFAVAYRNARGQGGKYEAFTARLIRSRVLGTGANSQALAETITEAGFNFDGYEAFYDNIARKAWAMAKKAGRGVVAVYQFMDDVWKTYAFMNEYSRYAKIGAKRGWSEQQVWDKSAEIVTDTYPTYYKLPEANTVIRRNPLFGPYVSFQSAVLRVHYKTAQLIREEYKNEDTRALAVMRFAGTTAALLMAPVLNEMFKRLVGADDDDEKHLRTLVSPYEKYSTLLLQSNPRVSGTLDYIDASFTLANASIADFFMTVVRGAKDGEIKQAIGTAVAQFAGTYTGTELLFGALVDVARNEKENGGKVWNPALERIPGGWVEQQKAIGTHLFNAWASGTMKGIRDYGRAKDQEAGAQDLYGNRYTRGGVLGRMFSGINPKSKEIGPAAASWVKQAVKGTTEATAFLTAELYGAPPTDENIEQAVRMMEMSRQAYWMDMKRVVDACRHFGKSNTEIKQILKAGGVGQDDVPGLVSSRPYYRQWDPSGQFASTVQRRIGLTADKQKGTAELNRRLTVAKRYLPVLKRENNLGILPEGVQVR